MQRVDKTPELLRLERLYRWADRLNDMATELRNADKPADLTFPYHILLEVAREVLHFRDYWMIKR